MNVSIIYKAFSSIYESGYSLRRILEVSAQLSSKQRVNIESVDLFLRERLASWEKTEREIALASVFYH